MLLKYNEIAAIFDLAPQIEDKFLTLAVTDSREVKPSTLFVCIQGEHADGHDFALLAEKAGATAILASRELPLLHIPVLTVSNTVKALGQIALYWRNCTRAKIIGVTGTAGKTTLKELLAQLLSIRGKTARNLFNYNNQIGMPRAMLATDGDENFWVMEVGISREGDMEELGEILRPDLGLILNVGAGHTEGLGEKGVAAHKAALLRSMSPDGYGLISADYPELVRESIKTGAKLHFFSTKDPSAQYYAVYEGIVRLGENHNAPSGRYRLCLDGEWIEATTPFSGQCGTENCIAAAAAAHLLGLSHDQITAGLTNAKTPMQRFCHKSFDHWDIIDDTYNANPLSMRRMLEASRELAGNRAFIPILGEMLELGDIAANEHERLGYYLATLAPTSVIWKGGHAQDVFAGLVKGKYDGIFLTIKKSEEFMPIIQDLLSDKKLNSKGGVLLFKGSRANKLEIELANLCTHYDDGPSTAK